MWLVHAGNRIDSDDRAHPRFPAGAVPIVEERLHRFLGEVRPTGIVSAAAAGADLLVLDVARDLGLRTEVVLPLPEGQFVERSVADQGEEWVRRFRRVRDHSTVHQADLSADPEWYLAGNQLVIDEALRLVAAHNATSDWEAEEGLLALAVRPADDAGSVTADFVHRARQRGLTTIDIDPSTPLRRRAFVAMPFGRKRDASRDVTIDFDATFRKLIVPLLEDADLDWTRADRATDAGLIHIGMIEQLATADLVVADLTLENPNVFYEVGLRHVLRPRATVLIHRSGSASVFDVKPLRQFRYTLAHAAITDTEALAAIRDLGPAIATAVEDTTRPDSPIHTLFDVTDVHITPRHPTPEQEQFDSLAQEIDRIERAARRPGGINGDGLAHPDDLRCRITELQVNSESRRALLLRLGVALRHAGRYQEAIDTFTVEPPGRDDPDLTDSLREQALCHRRVAEAAATRGDDPTRGWNRALLLLDELIASGRADPDTHGVAGGLDKRMAIRELDLGNRVRAGSHLREAARHYTDGSEFDPTDYYLHLNVVTTLRLLGRHFDDPDATERALQRLPIALHFAKRAADADPTDAYAAASVGELELTAHLLDLDGDHAPAAASWYATANLRASHDQKVAMRDQLDVYRRLDGELEILDGLQTALMR